ncbi:hypothetical protein ACH5RR_023026 [Cinchona calisaya]|uniref:Uncharacterized protein n=1 Tax=Cinchona calisaya TaxID=153742 RepID=A0ABD2ZAK6_9GENT
MEKKLFSNKQFKKRLKKKTKTKTNGCIGTIGKELIECLVLKDKWRPKTEVQERRQLEEEDEDSRGRKGCSGAICGRRDRKKGFNGGCRKEDGGLGRKGLGEI